MNKRNECQDHESNAEVVAEIVKRIPTIGYILAVGVAAALITTAIFAVIYGVTWLHRPEPHFQFQPTQSYGRQTDFNYEQY
jgi:hypothetical protein